MHTTYWTCDCRGYLQLFVHYQSTKPHCPPRKDTILCPFPFCVGWWERTRLQAYYLSPPPPPPKHTHLILQVDWVPTEDRGPHGAEGRATFNPPIAVALIITLYRVSHPSLSSPLISSALSSASLICSLVCWSIHFQSTHNLCVCAMQSCLLCQLKFRCGSPTCQHLCLCLRVLMFDVRDSATSSELVDQRTSLFHVSNCHMWGDKEPWIVLGPIS